MRPIWPDKWLGSPIFIWSLEFGQIITEDLNPQIPVVVGSKTCGPVKFTIVYRVQLLK